VTAATRPQRHDTARLLQSSAIVGLGTALSRITGYMRVAAISYALGVSTLAGVYSWANETPNIVYELLLGGVLTATLVPQFVRHLQDDDPDATSAVFTVAMIGLLVITIVGVLAAPLIARLYLLDVHGEEIQPRDQRSCEHADDRDDEQTDHRDGEDRARRVRDRKSVV